MLRGWEILENVYKPGGVSQTKLIGDDLLEVCVGTDLCENDNPSMDSTSVISQKSLFSYCDSHRNMERMIVPYECLPQRCVDVTNDEDALPDFVEAEPIVEET